MRAILIDPKAKQITQIDYNGNYETIYEHLSFTNSFGNSHKIRAFEQQGGVGLRYQADESNYDKLLNKLEKELF